jgi:acetyl-CoA carboxylase carboxyl transferase subunit alpha
VNKLSRDYTLDFEKPVKELENQIKELKEVDKKPDIDISKEIKGLEKKVNILIREIYGKLSPWERVQLSRHPNRPHAIDYINDLITDFHELHGDRHFADDPALITGMGYFNEQRVAIVAIEKGRKTKEKIHHNFGMPRPEGYRKALRVMKLASQFNIPILCFVDTPGAYPGIGAEERGQAQAIAENLAQMFDVSSPIIAVVLGEGGSGGALGIAIADRVLMMEYSIYSVISPESCASILWADPKMAEMAANSLKLGPQKALELGIIDSIIAEPAGGAHKDPEKASQILRETLAKSLKEVTALSIDKIKQERFSKYRKMGNSTLLEEQA